MKELTAVVLLTLGFCLPADAEIWKWVDENGNVHYGDKPPTEYVMDAESVTYVANNRRTSTSRDGHTDTRRGNNVDTEKAPGNSSEKEDAQAYYCQRAKDIYNSYVNAPRLYRTSEDGQRDYLSDEEMAATLADAEAKVDEWCNQG